MNIYLMGLVWEFKDMFYINDNADEQQSFLTSLPGAGTEHTSRVGIIECVWLQNRGQSHNSIPALSPWVSFLTTQSLSNFREWQQKV